MQRTSLATSQVTVQSVDGPILNEVSFVANSGERIGVVGPNGVGKSTLLNVLAGSLRCDQGNVILTPADASIAFVRQELGDGGAASVMDFLAQECGVFQAEDRLARATDKMATAYTDRAGEEYASALEHWECVGAPDFSTRAHAVLAQVGLEAGRDAPVGALSGGERSRVQLAIALLSLAPILLLDEPTNDLDLDGMSLLENRLMRDDLVVVVVSHDRAFLDRVATAVLELDGHSRQGKLYRMSWREYRVEREKDRVKADAEYMQQRDVERRLKERMRREQEWAERGQRAASAANAKDGNKLARKRAATGAQTRTGKAREALDRARNQQVEKPWTSWELRLSFAEAPRGGDVVVDLRDASWERSGCSLGPLTLQIRTGDRIRVTGANGAGKTTLIRMLLGEEAPRGGEQRLAESARVSVLDQRRMLQARTSESAVAVTMRLGQASNEAARSSLAKLGLEKDDAVRPLEQLSPGERTRVALAAFQLRPTNFLVLDEPTNHLDFPAIEQLEQALNAYCGTLLVVSHDREFLESVTFTRTWAVSDGFVREH